MQPGSMELLRILLMVYAANLLINAIFSAVCLYYYRDRLYRYALYLWIGTIVNSFSQGIFQQGYPLMLLSFSTYFFCSLMLVQILNRVTELNLPIRLYSGLMGGALLVSLYACTLDLSFTLTALPVAVGVAFPMIHAAFRVFRDRERLSPGTGVWVYSALLLINGIHFLDYPFLRMNPDFAVFGFTIALGLLMAMSILLPSFIIKNISDRYSKDVSALNQKLVEYQNQITELMSLAQIGELSFGLVHDMTSPTTLLLYYSQEIASFRGTRAPTGKDILPYMKGIENATSRLVNLQRMFRAMISNEQDAPMTRVDLVQTIRSCVDLFSPYLQNSQIELQVDLPDGSAISCMKSGVIERVLLNLLQNAANALGAQESKKIALSLRSAPGSHFVSVKDNGPGIPPERFERLWERFGPSETAKMSERSRPGIPGGSGFGLYKVKQLVDEVGGSIHVESSAQGTAFEIELPAEVIALKIAS